MTRELRFNGAVTFQLRKSNTNKINYCSWFCFNGAVTFQLRKSWMSEHNTCSDVKMLQWGRNFSVTEISIKESQAKTRWLLQWGRNFSVTEILNCYLRSIVRTRRFNGAVTFQLRKFLWKIWI